MLCGDMVVYTTVDAMYHFVMLVSCMLLWKPAMDWPLLSVHPWTAKLVVYMKGSL